MSFNFNNLAITAMNTGISAGIGAGLNFIQGKLGNGGRDVNCKFYYDAGGGSILNVKAGGGFVGAVAGGIATSLVNGAVKELADTAVNAFNNFIGIKDGKKGSGSGNKQGTAWVNAELELIDEEKLRYGTIIPPDSGGKAIFALDDWGNICCDALMLMASTDTDRRYSQERSTYGMGHSETPTRYKGDTIKSKYLVWYDTTALVNVNSDKNVIATRVQGRDYSRKELVSNGDIKFSVSGQITSQYPDIYPSKEVQKFIEMMQYKGIIEVNNQILDQFGVTGIIITDFSLSPQQGYKSVQKYSFSAIGLQPQTTNVITEDTITMIPQSEGSEEADSRNNKTGWAGVLDNAKEGLKSGASSIFSQGVALSTGMLNKIL